MINICADTAYRKNCVMSEYIFSSNTFGDLHRGSVYLNIIVKKFLS